MNMISEQKKFKIIFMLKLDEPLWDFYDLNFINSLDLGFESKRLFGYFLLLFLPSGRVLIFGRIRNQEVKILWILMSSQFSYLATGRC